MKNKKSLVKGKDNTDITLKDLSEDEIIRGILGLFKNDIDNNTLRNKIVKVVQ